MISLLQPVPAGNALRVFVDPPRGARYWRILRRTADAFTGPDDAGAAMVADQCTDNVVLDTTALVNGTEYFYRAYSWLGAGWDDPASVSGTPAASYAGDGCDPLQILVDRLTAGLAVEVARGALKPASGAIKVYKAPFVQSDQIAFPVVFAHYDNWTPVERGLGEWDQPPVRGADGTWTEFEGFLARSTINIGATSRNVDERNDLRRALIRILQANLGVFAGLGLDLVEFNFGDSEMPVEQGAPLYLTGGIFSCVSHSFVAEGPIPAIADVTLLPTLTEGSIHG